MGEAAVAVATAPKTRSSSAKDLWRAKTKVPRKQYNGDTFAEMSKTLNGWLKRSKTVASTRECRDWTVKELQKLQAMLYVLRHDDLQDIYKSVDDNRKMRTKMDELKTSWDELNSYVHDGDHGDAVVSEEGRKYLHECPESVGEDAHKAKAV